MKKLLSFMTIVAAIAMIMTGCKKDEETDSESNRLVFTNTMLQNKTSFAWEGLETAQRKEMGSWNDEKTRYVVIRFDRSTTESTSGTGRLVAFRNSYKEDFVESSDFRWYFNNDMLYIEWKQSGWQTAHAEYRTSELVVNANSFIGYCFEKTDFRWQFNYTKSSFSDWDKYAN
ncbi:MAG: hypothetical protein J6W38_09670 [Prevotella sp.]|nr:hypothetical protein [Prevotella sp.]